MEKDKRLKRRHFLGPFIAVVIILTLIVVFYFKSINANELLRHTQDVKYAIKKVLTTLQDAEIGERGYIITQEKAYLEPYTLAVKRFQRAMNATRKLVQDNPEQLMRLDTIQKLSVLKFNELEETIKLIKKGDVIGAISIVREDLGKINMDKMRSVADEMNLEENRLMIERNQDLTLWRNLIIAIILVSLFIIALTLLKLYKRIKPLFDELNKTKNQLKHVNDNLSESLYNTKKLNHDKLLEIEARTKTTLENEQLISQLRLRNQALENLTIDLNSVQRIYEDKVSEVAPDYAFAIHRIIEKMKLSFDGFNDDDDKHNEI